MKKTFAALTAATLMATMALPAFAYDNQELFSTLDKTYYNQLQGQNASINVYSWGEYISNGEDDSLNVNKAFEELTGIKVVYSNYGTNEELYARLKGGGSSYDVIIPSDYMIARMMQEDMLEPLNKANLPSLHYLNPTFTNMPFDPQDTYSVPYTWGTVVLIYNTTKLKPDTDVETWNLLWNEDYKGQILMFNNPRDAYAIALKRMGKNLNPDSIASIDAATVELKKQRPIVQAYVMDEIFDKMGTGEATIAPYYAGDAVTMMRENPNLAAAYPREGTNIFVDSMCIPKGSSQQQAAEMYINFMNEPVVSAANVEYIGYSTPNVEAMKLLPAEVTSNPFAYPSDEVIQKAEYFNLLPDELNLALDSGWKETLTDDAGFSFWLVPALLLIVVVASVMMVIRKNAKKNKQY